MEGSGLNSSIVKLPGSLSGSTSPEETLGRRELPAGVGLLRRSVEPVGRSSGRTDAPVKNLRSGERVSTSGARFSELSSPDNSIEIDRMVLQLPNPGSVRERPVASREYD